MEGLSLATMAAIPISLAVLCFSYLQSGNSRKPRFPPSPKSDPIIGNLRIMPTRNEHMVYREWSMELKSTY